MTEMMHLVLLLAEHYNFMMKGEDSSEHRYSSPPQQPSSFFACLNCYRDQQ